MVERRYLQKGLLEKLLAKISRVLATFAPARFPAETRNALVEFCQFLDEDFRRGVVTGSGEDDARIDFAMGLEKHCLQSPEFSSEAKDFVEARKTFKDNLAIFLQMLRGLEGQQYSNLRVFKELERLSV